MVALNSPSIISSGCRSQKGCDIRVAALNSLSVLSHAVAVRNEMTAGWLPSILCRLSAWVAAVRKEMTAKWLLSILRRFTSMLPRSERR